MRLVAIGEDACSGNVIRQEIPKLEAVSLIVLYGFPSRPCMTMKSTPKDSLPDPLLFGSPSLIKMRPCCSLLFVIAAAVDSVHSLLVGSAVVAGSGCSFSGFTVDVSGLV